MKPILTFFLTTFLVTITFAQKGINYKALIKDDANNVLANQNITIEFSILEGPEIDFLDVLYTETHTAITDANGIVIVNIGEGVPSTGFDEHDYEDLDWGHPFFSHFLKVQIDSGSGLIDMGTTEFKAVPYALFALNSNSTNTGLELINEGSGQGWRLIGKNPDFYGIIGSGAVDLSQSGSDDGTNGASGYNSFAAGINTKAMGTQSTALGARTIASGHTSVALGQYTRAEAPNSTAIGLFNIGGGDPLLVSATDPLFEIGNGNYVDGGTNDVRTNALTVLRNGNATLAGTLTQNSDERLKTNIEDIPYGLHEILQMNPVYYNWKRYPEKRKSLGLIAQDIQTIINEIVHQAKDKDKTLSVSYTELIPVLVKAIQEQQDIIENQNTKIEDLSAQISQFEDLSKRITNLESLNTPQ